jgi:hypothetical protein
LSNLRPDEGKEDFMPTVAELVEAFNNKAPWHRPKESE